MDWIVDVYSDHLFEDFEPRLLPRHRKGYRTIEHRSINQARSREIVRADGEKEGAAAAAGVVVIHRGAYRRRADRNEENSYRRATVPR